MTPSTLLHDSSGGIGGGMEVDQDVAVWLDSLLPSQSPQGQQNQINGGGHDSGIGEMNGNNGEQAVCTQIPNGGNLLSDHSKNCSNNNLQTGSSSINTMMGIADVQNDSFLDDSDMIMSTLQSPIPTHPNLPDGQFATIIQPDSMIE